MRKHKWIWRRGWRTGGKREVLPRGEAQRGDEWSDLQAAVALLQQQPRPSAQPRDAEMVAFGWTAVETGSGRSQAPHLMQDGVRERLRARGEV